MKIPQFNLNVTEKNDVHKIVLNGLYIGRIFKHYPTGYQFVPKGFGGSFARNHITLKSFNNVDETLLYIKAIAVNTYKKEGKFI